MKRSESMLVYGVAGVLALILVIAVVFGEPGATNGGAGEGSDGDQKNDALQELLPNDDYVDPNEFVDPNAGGDSGDGEDPNSGTAEASGNQGEPTEADWASRRGERDVRTVIGPFRQERSPNGDKFRVVEVRSGDTFSELVERWTGSIGNMRDAQALNEELNLRNLTVGTEVWLPWVEDEVLLAVYQSNDNGGEAAAPGRVPLRSRSSERPNERPAGGGAVAQPATVETVTPTPAPATSESYVMKTGESLWKVAEARVGRRNASAYIDEIAKLNGITDTGRVRAGQKILLPPAPAR